MIMKNTVGSARNVPGITGPDSREDMEQDLHERYDTYKDPRQHDWYRAGTEDAGRNTNRTSNQNPHIAIRTKITANGREKRKKGRHQ